ncbi:MAG: primase-like DNA-binding domain-containing protein [Candidatus Micrarchaeaceae archaeon]
MENLSINEIVYLMENNNDTDKKLLLELLRILCEKTYISEDRNLILNVITKNIEKYDLKSDERYLDYAFKTKIYELIELFIIKGAKISDYSLLEAIKYYILYDDENIHLLLSNNKEYIDMLNKIKNSSLNYKELIQNCDENWIKNLRTESIQKDETKQQNVNMLKLLIDGSDFALSELFYKLYNKNVKVLLDIESVYIWNKEIKLWQEKDITLFSDFVFESLKSLYISAMSSIKKTNSQVIISDAEIKSILSELTYLESIENQENLDIRKNIYDKLVKNIEQLYKKRTITGIIKILKCNLNDKNFLLLLNSKNNLLSLKSSIYGDHVVLDLKTGVIRERTKKDYFSYELNVFYNPQSVCQNFDIYLNYITCEDNGVKEELKNIFGYSITGDCRNKIVFILRSDKINDIFTLISILKNVLNIEEFFTLIYKNILNDKQLSCRTIYNELFKLKSSRIVIYWNVFNNSEKLINISKTHILNEYPEIEEFEYLGKIFRFLRKFKIFFITNSKPYISDDTHILDKVKVIELKGKNNDNNLIDKILNDENEKSGILNWLISGALNYYKNGLKLNYTDSIPKDTIKSDNNTVDKFINDCCEFGPDKEIKALELYNCYKTYCENNSLKCLSNVLFAKKILSLGDNIQRKRRKVGNFYIGLTVKM